MLESLGEPLLVHALILPPDDEPLNDPGGHPRGWKSRSIW
jgi:hypothetical protein